MKRKLQQVFFCFSFLLIVVTTGFAQEKVTGKVVDAETNEGLPGATVTIFGTTDGTTTNVDGDFSLTVKSSGTKLIINYIGYNTKTVVVNNSKKLGSIGLEPSSTSLSEIVISTASVAVDRKTPVAVSTIGKAFIQEKLGGQEFPEVLKSTPGIQVTKQGGGYGDARVNIRGFKGSNVAVLVNGIPINDMEGGTVYWSNWAGLADVTSSMQVQRGLGASKVAVPSLGGTINIITNSTDVKKGGSVSQFLGNDGYAKTSLYLTTGLNEKGWAVSLFGSKATGNGWADGLQFESYNYFFNVSKIINPTNRLSFTVMGAPQVHGQRSTKQSIADFRNAPQGLKFNADWGVKDGEVLSLRNNFYHKPIASLNHYWDINPTTSLATVAYASMGTGGGGTAWPSSSTSGLARTGDEYSPIDFDSIVDQNIVQQGEISSFYLKSSRNDHKWYGVMSTLTKKLSDNINLLGGVDLRAYKGIHFQEVTDLLGGTYAYDEFKGAGISGNANKPGALARTGDKVGYNYNSNVLWEGLFLQAEYAKDALSAFVSLAGSNNSMRRIDYFSYLDSDPAQTSDYQNFLGYQAKGGANYNIDEHNNVFANIGVLSKAPILTNVFLNYRNDINPDAVNEKLFSYELGYGYRSANFTGNLNLYRSTYKDRAYTKSQTNPGGEVYFANITGVDELHQGAELDLKNKLKDKLTLTGMFSVGDWKYLNNVGPVQIFDEDQVPVGSPISKMYLKDQKVGDQAQTTLALGLEFNVLPQFKLGADYNYYANYRADFNFYSLTQESSTPWKIPNYSLVDANAVFDFKLGNLNASFYANVNNVFNTEYISDAFDSTGSGTAASSIVFYGFGTTYTTGLKVKF
jgi:hypothetical protein